ncbi:MAG TPA: biopolymer transporter ExbD [Opitutaceae bacterium]|nr:biopolymer transporter ExbD [Opitutaceae bacterium]
MKLTKTVRKKARIEIIPLIDVIMFLLATFVLFTLTMNKNKQIPMELPQGGGISDGTEVKPITISIDSAGDYFWMGERVTFDDVLIRLNGYKAQSGDPKVLIEGEIGAQFGKAVVLVDEARLIGINKVTFNTSARQSVRQ